MTKISFDGGDWKRFPDDARIEISTSEDKRAYKVESINGETMIVKREFFLIRWYFKIKYWLFSRKYGIRR